MVNQEDIVTLTHHVRNFSAALNTLRNTFTESGGAGDLPDETRARAHERLGEVLSILKGVLKLYPPLNSVEILSSAGTVIQKIKNHDYMENEELEAFYQATDQLAWAFSSSVSDFLMGDQDGGSTPVDFPIGHARSFDNFSQENGDFHGDELGDEEHDEYQSDHAGSEVSLDKGFEDSKGFSTSLEDQEVESSSKGLDQSAQKARELDKVLLSMENGIDITLQRTKTWSKYAKDILNYMEKRAHLEIDYSKALAKLAQTTKASISEEHFLPLQSTLITTLDYDVEYANNCQNIYQNLVTSKIIEPLQSRRTDHDRARSKLKDMWNKECKKLQDCRLNLKKAKTLYFQKQQELEKFSKQLEARENKEESSTPAFSIGKKRKEEDVAKKAEESEDYYKQCVQEANRREQDLEKIRAKVLLELRQLIYQCDMTMKAVTVAYFQMMQSLAAPLPYHFQTLADGGREYEVGARFAEYTKLQRATSQPLRSQRHSFEPYRSGDRDDRHNRSNSGLMDLSIGGVGLSPEPEAGFKEGQFRKDRRSSAGSVGSDISNHRPPSPGVIGKAPKNAWGQQRGSASDDTDSLTSRSLPASPVGSPTATRRSKELSLLSPEPPSDEEMLDKDAPLKKFSPGPFRNYKLSAAANTHCFRKLRSPSKCKECDSYVYFNGAECEQCSITCHKKCLETLAIKCGHRPLPRKMTTFGVDFQKHLQATKRSDIPILIEKCIDEIDSRGLEFKGLYRVSGVKSKVERLCQQFETGADLVDLSTTPLQVVSSVLKLYLRQLPEPLLTFDLYQDFIQIAKDSMTCKFDQGDEEGSEENDAKCEEVLSRLHKVVKNLPHANLCTAEKLIRHLKRVSRHSHKNSMTVGGLAIVFGPTLLRPRGRPDSLPALMDMTHQTRVVELLIMHPKIVDEETFDDMDPSKNDSQEHDTKKAVEAEKSGTSKGQQESLPVNEFGSETSIAGQFTEEMLAAWGQGESTSKVDHGIGIIPPGSSDKADKDSDNHEVKSPDQKDVVTQKLPGGSEITVVKSPTQSVGYPIEALIRLSTPDEDDAVTDVSQNYTTDVQPLLVEKAASNTSPKSDAPKELVKSGVEDKKGSISEQGQVETPNTPTLKELAMEEALKKEDVLPKEESGGKEGGRGITRERVSLKRNNAKREVDIPEKLLQLRNGSEASSCPKNGSLAEVEVEFIVEKDFSSKTEVKESQGFNSKVSLSSSSLQESGKQGIDEKNVEGQVKGAAANISLIKDNVVKSQVDKNKGPELAYSRSHISKEEKEEDLVTFMSKLRMEISLSDDDVHVNAISREGSVVSLEDIPLSPRSLNDGSKRHSSASTSSSSEKAAFSPRGSLDGLDDSLSPPVVRSKTLPESVLRVGDKGGGQVQGKDVPRVPPKPGKVQASPPRRNMPLRQYPPDEEGISRRSSRDAMKLGNTKKLVERFSHETLKEGKEVGLRHETLKEGKEVGLRHETLKEGKEVGLRRVESSDSDDSKVEGGVSVKDMKKQFESSRTQKETGIEMELGLGAMPDSSKPSSAGNEKSVDTSSPRMVQQRSSRERIMALEGNGPRDRKPEFV